MNITVKEVQLDLSGQEAYTMAWQLFEYQKKSIRTHYISLHHDSYKKGVTHSIELFIEQSSKEIVIIEQLFCGAGNLYMAMQTKDDLLAYIKKQYLKKHGSEDYPNKGG